MSLDVRAIALRATTAAVLLTGALLRVYAYLRQPSMWIDEIAITRNIIDRSLWQLVSIPLDYGQVAPVGYLVLVKGLVAMFGSSELVLRFPALVSSLAALLLFRRVAEHLADGFAAPASTALVAIGPVVLYQAAQVKQYSSDFALSLLILLLAIALWQGRGRTLTIAVAGAAAVWFSQHAIVTAAGVAAGLTLLCSIDRRAVRAWRVAIVLSAWGASAALSLLVSVHNLTPALTDYMRHFWASGFMPLHAHRPLDSLRWVWVQLQRVFIQWNARPWRTDDVVPELYALFALVGLVALAHRRREAAILPFSCIAVVLACSAAQWYPFPPFVAQRLILFESSLLILMSAAGVEWLMRTMVRAAPGAASAATAAVSLIAFAAPTVYAAVKFPPPYKHDMAAEMLAEIRTRWQPADIIYANSGVAMGVLYYAPRFGFRRADIIASECSTDSRTSLRELDQLRGRRVWVVVNNGRDQRSLLDSYLRTIGRRVESVAVDGPGTWESMLIRPEQPEGRPLCAAYDLRDPNLLARSSADRFVIASNLTFYDAPWWCYGVFRPLVRESGLRTED